MNKYPLPIFMVLSMYTYVHNLLVGYSFSIHVFVKCSHMLIMNLDSIHRCLKCSRVNNMFMWYLRNIHGCVKCSHTWLVCLCNICLVPTDGSNINIFVWYVRSIHGCVKCSHRLIFSCDIWIVSMDASNVHTCEQCVRVVCHLYLWMHQIRLSRLNK